MMRIEKRMVELELMVRSDAWNLYTFVGMIASFMTFIAGSVWDNVSGASTPEKEPDSEGHAALIVEAVGEYGYMICCVIMVSSSNYSRNSLLTDFDCRELLNINIFSLRTLLSECLFSEGKYIFDLNSRRRQSIWC